jgi:hypothetical protein
MQGTLAATTRTRTIRLKWGGQQIAGYQTSASTNVNFRMNAIITRRTATSATIAYDADFSDSSGVRNGSWVGSNLVTAAPNMDANVLFEATVQSATGAVAGDLVVRDFTVEILNVG